MFQNEAEMKEALVRLLIENGYYVFVSSKAFLEKHKDLMNNKMVEYIDSIPRGGSLHPFVMLLKTHIDVKAYKDDVIYAFELKCLGTRNSYTPCCDMVIGQTLRDYYEIEHLGKVKVIAVIGRRNNGKFTISLDTVIRYYKGIIDRFSLPINAVAFGKDNTSVFVKEIGGT